LQQSLTDGDCTFSLHTHAQKDGDQFGIGQSLWAK